MTKDEALELALEALTYIYTETTADEDELIDQAITAIKEALAQPEQEPVAFYVYKPTLPRGQLGNVSDGDLPWVYDQDPSSGYSARMLVYTTPPQRTWVGLTDEEIDAVTDSQWAKGVNKPIYAAHRAYARAIETKLKEKNGA